MTVNTYFIYPFCMMLHSFNSLWLDSWEKAFVCLPRVVAPSAWWRVRREGRAAPPRGAQERALWERAPARGQGRRASGAEGSKPEPMAEAAMPCTAQAPSQAPQKERLVPAIKKGLHTIWRGAGVNWKAPGLGARWEERTPATCEDVGAREKTVNKHYLF